MDAAARPARADAALGPDYLAAMRLAGRYAYAGRDVVVAHVLDILGTRATEEVHNHHNFGWREQIGGEELGSSARARRRTAPASAFVGGSMGEASVILEGVESEQSRRALDRPRRGPGIAARGGRPTGSGGEAPRWRPRASSCAAAAPTRPAAYKRLSDVLAAHASTVRVVHTLRPIGVAMAGPRSSTRTRTERRARGVREPLALRRDDLDLYPERLHAPGQVAPQPAREAPRQRAVITAS